ncbi:MAG: S9 family peptidase [Pseudomonadota bacterium]
MIIEVNGVRFNQLLVVLTIILGALLGMNDANAARRFDDDVALALRSVSDPQISPDGSKIAYGLSWFDRGGEGVEKSAIWIMDADGENARRLTAGGGALWSPDGSLLLYSSADGQGRSQLFVRDLNGALVRQVTQGDQPPIGAAWSPDGQSIAFYRLATESPGAVYEWPEGVAPRGEERIVKRLHHKYDGIGFIDHGYLQLFVASIDGGEARQLTDGPGEVSYEWGLATPTWSPDGKYIVVAANFVDDADMSYRESYIYRVNARSGATKKLFDDPTGTDFFNRPAYSPDGKSIAFYGYAWAEQHVYRPEKLWVVDAHGGNRRDLTADVALGEGAYDFHWSPDGDGLYFGDSREGARNLYYAPLDGDVRAVTTGVQSLSVSSAAANGQAVGVRRLVQKTGDIVTFPLRDPSAMRQLTDVNAAVLADVDLGGIEDFWYETKDGTRIQAWIYTPPGFDPSKKYPMIVTAHGGPQGMTNGLGIEPHYYRYAAEGYVVFDPNYRNSTGYGEAFMNQADPWFPNDRVTDDILSGVDAMLAKGYVDPDRLFMTGYSAGGVLTSWMVGQTGVFKAAVAQAPETNRISDTLTSDIVQWFATKYPKPFWEDPSSWLASSPIMYADKVTTPTLIIVGDADMRTPSGQSNEFFTALKLAGKAPTELIYVPDAYHNTEYGYAHMRWRFHILNWFRKYDPAYND